MNPEWRTSTVVELCRGMRETQDYSAAPILADALQDAGCNDEKMLAELRWLPERNYGRRFEDHCRKVARHICAAESPEGDEAVCWISSFAGELCQTEERLIEAADLWAETAEDGTYPEYTYDNSERYKDVDNDKWKVFWAHYERLTGRKVKDNDCPFTCSC